MWKWQMQGTGTRGFMASWSYCSKSENWMWFCVCPILGTTCTKSIEKMTIDKGFLERKCCFKQNKTKQDQYLKNDAIKKTIAQYAKRKETVLPKNDYIRWMITWLEGYRLSWLILSRSSSANAGSIMTNKSL